MTEQRDDRHYAATHEWVALDGDLAVVGISDHAQKALGDITFVDLPEVGTHVGAFEECCIIESVKAASDVYAPVTGEVAEINEALDAHPELVNKDPCGKGWLFKLKGVDPEEVERLMDAQAYAATLENA